MAWEKLLFGVGRFLQGESEFNVGVGKGPVKLINPMKIAHSILQSVSNQFHIIILSLPT